VACPSTHARSRHRGWNANRRLHQHRARAQSRPQPQVGHAVPTQATHAGAVHGVQAGMEMRCELPQTVPPTTRHRQTSRPAQRGSATRWRAFHACNWLPSPTKQQASKRAECSRVPQAATSHDGAALALAAGGRPRLSRLWGRRHLGGGRGLARARGVRRRSGVSRGRARGS